MTDTYKQLFLDKFRDTKVPEGYRLAFLLKKDDNSMEYISPQLEKIPEGEDATPVFREE